MGSIYVVRHGQAAFGTDDYDRLTEVGLAQARLLGEYFAARRLRFDAVFTGTLLRQQQTARGLLQGGTDLAAEVAEEHFTGLNEYDPEAILLAHTGNVPAPAAAAARRDPKVVREHFRMLRDALTAWAEDRIQPKGMLAFQGFQEGAVAALIEARQRFPDGKVLIVSSGGPIAAMVAASLNAPPSAAVELNLRIRNCSVTEFTSNPKRHSLLSFNAVPHLDAQPDASLITYA
ncbi:MAG TPA: histidine phosphatase family protein [Steroidobacteraceae bacterium]